MENLSEELFEQVFRAGALRDVSLVMHDGRACISFVVGEDSQGLVMTKRGEVKQYRVETALAFLRRCGLVKVNIDMASWTIEQG